MDAETKALQRVLSYRDNLRARMAASDRELTLALAAWSASRPGHVKGKTTEQGARFVLRQAGLL